MNYFVGLVPPRDHRAMVERITWRVGLHRRDVVRGCKELSLLAAQTTCSEPLQTLGWRGELLFGNHIKSHKTPNPVRPHME